VRCAGFERYGEDWLGGDAPAEFEAHLRSCARCRAAAEEIAGSRALLKVLRADPPEASPAFWARLEDALTQADRKAEFWASLVWTAQRAALALGALALGLGLWLWSHPAPPVAAFDAPEVFLAEDTPLPGPGTSEPLDRDQVVLTLVAREQEE
jgi:hypothetical protein